MKRSWADDIANPDPGLVVLNLDVLPKHFDGDHLIRLQAVACSINRVLRQADTETRVRAGFINIDLSGWSHIYGLECLRGLDDATITALVTDLMPTLMAAGWQLEVEDKLCVRYHLRRYYARAV